MDLELYREMNALKGDLNMTKLAVSSVQNEMKEQLNGSMGEDMIAVLNGDVKVDVGFVERKKFKIKSWFKRLFRFF